VLFEMNREVNAALSSDEELSRETLEAIDELYRSLGGDILGLAFEGAAPLQRGLESSLIDILLSTRASLRVAKEWKLADKIRSDLKELGITLEDRPEGTVWRYGRR